ncbi:MerR family transcriptional regulator [Aeriscardovia aeriphila]|uniref:Transcriptional regulator n=1 Tax=Aeriscardovia aeriphila TaxID=218139 RepID=A0A261FAU7_9BIFI|nr:MerR family transcriptional regulator [Aeriscardovia aeriphila]NYI25757.1 DNA-binding transcriptional MerR regulator [Aeriscardovia aeriphila]OZG56093.1 transcriptional regulator [Aeriscardovia aeriphila]
MAANEHSAVNNRTDNLENAIQGQLFSGPKKPRLAYSGAIAQQVAGITYRQLDYWANKHIVEPSLHASHGSGTRRLYSYTDILLLGVAKRLIDAGINLTNIALIIAKLRRQPLEEFSHTFIMSDGHKVMECTDDMSIIDMMREGTAVFGLSVARLDEDLSARLRAFSPIRLDEEAVSSVTGRSLESVDHGPVLLADLELGEKHSSSASRAVTARASHASAAHAAGSNSALRTNLQTNTSDSVTGSSADASASSSSKAPSTASQSNEESVKSKTRSTYSQRRTRRVSKHEEVAELSLFDALFS